MTLEPLASMRHLFDIPDHITYLNCAYLSPMLKSAAEAGHIGIDRKARPWEIFPEHFFDQSEQVRSLFAKMIGGKASQVAIVPSVSYGIGLAAKNLPLAQGKRILVLEDQFPSNYYPWQDSARRNGGELLVVPRPVNDDWTSAVLALLDERIGIVALPHCHWTDGSMVDLERIGAVCWDLNIPLAVDPTQSLGVIPFDVKKVKPAFLATATYKWLLGPYSLSLLYADEAWLGGEPLEFNWIGRKGSTNFSGLVRYTDHMESGAARYDMGERSNFVALPMVMSALQQILDWGVPRIAHTLGNFNNELTQQAAQLGFRRVNPEHAAPHLTGLRFDGKLPATMAEALRKKDIFVSIRGDAVRVAPYLYNDANDRQRLVQALAELV